MKNRKHIDRRRIREVSERYHEIASDLFTGADSDNSRYRPKLESALISIKRALLFDPDNYQFLVLTGDILAAIDTKPAVVEALKYYDRAISIRPDHPDAYDSKASVLMFQTHPPDENAAESLSRRAVSLALGMQVEQEILEMSYLGLIDILEARKKFKEDPMDDIEGAEGLPERVHERYCARHARTYSCARDMRKMRCTPSAHHRDRIQS